VGPGWGLGRAGVGPCHRPPGGVMDCLLVRGLVARRAHDCCRQIHLPVRVPRFPLPAFCLPAPEGRTKEPRDHSSAPPGRGSQRQREDCGFDRRLKPPATVVRPPGGGCGGEGDASTGSTAITRSERRVIAAQRSVVGPPARLIVLAGGRGLVRDRSEYTSEHDHSLRAASDRGTSQRDRATCPHHGVIGPPAALTQLRAQ
jgi:hypothetical protein